MQASNAIQKNKKKLNPSFEGRTTEIQKVE